MVINYVYDIDGNRINNIMNNSGYRYIYGANGQTELREKIVNGSVTQVIHNIFGNDLLGTNTVTSTSSEKNYFLKDHLGSIKVIVDESGSVSEYNDYDPFGLELTGRSNSEERYKFTGKERDTETSYDYFGARYYDSRIGRWLQVDPLAEKYTGWSTYNYTMNNPLKFIDPNGMWTDPIKNPKYRGWYGNTWAPGKSHFGIGVRQNGKRNHQGVDIEAKVGTSAVAVEKGIIVSIKDSKIGFGKTVMLEFTDKDGNKVYAQYAHMSEVTVEVNQDIEEGDEVGKTGKTGNAEDLSSNEEHLHFGISTTPTPSKGLKDYKNPEDYMEIETPKKPKEENKQKEN